jgi:hypothetical protein
VSAALAGAVLFVAALIGLLWLGEWSLAALLLGLPVAGLASLLALFAPRVDGLLRCRDRLHGGQRPLGIERDD